MKFPGHFCPVLTRCYQVGNSLAAAVAVNIDVAVPEPLPPNINQTKKSHYISQVTGKNQTFTATGRKVAIYVLDNYDGATVIALRGVLAAAGCMTVVVGPRKGYVKSGTAGTPDLNTQFTFETSRSTIFDAVFFAGGSGDEYLVQMSKSGHLIHAAREAYSHFKTIGSSGSAVSWLEQIALPKVWSVYTGEAVVVLPGIVRAQGLGDAKEFAQKFVEEISKHRAWDRDVSMVAA